jgi:hypothetical protein
MAVNTVEWQANLAADTNRHPSKAIWGDCPIETIREDPTYGVHIFEDFIGFGKTTAVASNVGRYYGETGAWISWEDTSCTLTTPVQTTPDSNGMLRSTLTGTAHLANVLAYGYGTAYSSGSTGPFIYTDGVGGKLWFEARVRFNSVSASTNIFFIGLAQSGCAVTLAAATSTTTLFDSTDGVGNVDLLGFDILQAAPSVVRGVYGINGSARTSAGTAQTAVAATWYKLGFIVDPLAPFTSMSSGVTLKRKKMRWFVDGVEVQSLSDTATSPFPTAKVLTPTFHSSNGGTGTAGTIDIDYIRAAQVYPA